LDRRPIDCSTPSLAGFRAHAEVRHVPADRTGCPAPVPSTTEAIVAEIPIQEKKRRNLLPLILGALVLLLLLGWCMRRGRDNDANRTDTAGAIAPAPTDTAVAAPPPATDTTRLDTTKARTDTTKRP
jgi:hypothetical protein